MPCAKLCSAVLLVVCASAHAGEWVVRWPVSRYSVLYNLLPPLAVVPSSGHLGMESSMVRNMRGPGIAIDSRTFVAGGVHYRLYGAPAEDPGSPQEREARAALQALLDSGVIVQVVRLGR